MRVAIDLDGTLAATAPAAFSLIEGPAHDYGYDDMESWAWGIEEFGKAAFLDAMWHVWTLRPLQVEKADPTPASALSGLIGVVDTVNVVTAHPDRDGISQGKKDWLEYHSISYDKFVRVPMDKSKAWLSYDVFVDDKPHLVDEVDDDQRVFLVDRPYNQPEHLDAEPYRRVGSVSEACQIIRAEHETGDLIHA